MQTSKAIGLYLIQVAFPALLIVIPLGYCFGWVIKFCSEYFGLFKTAYQYELIIPGFTIIGILLWGFRIVDDIFLIVSTEQKSKGSDSIDI